MGARGASERNSRRKCLERSRFERDAWDEAGSWEAEEGQIEGSFADEDEEEAINLAGTQLNEALASGRNARRTVAQARAIMHDIKSSRVGYYPQAKVKDKARTKTVVVERTDESSWKETSQADVSISKDRA